MSNTKGTEHAKARGIFRGSGQGTGMHGSDVVEVSATKGKCHFTPLVTQGLNRQSMGPVEGDDFLHQAAHPTRLAPFGCVELTLKPCRLFG